MCRFEARSPVWCVDRYLAQVGDFYGLVRCQTWRDTFSADYQWQKAEVRIALIAYLEETREEWEPVMAELEKELEAKRAIEQRAAEEAAAWAEREAEIEAESRTTFTPDSDAAPDEAMAGEVPVASEAS